MTNSTAKPDDQQRPAGFFIPLHLEHDEEALELADWIRYFWSKKWMIMAVTAAAIVLAVVVALLATPVYRAEVLLVPNTENSESSSLSGFADQFGGLSSLAGFDVDGDSNVQEAIATINSRDFTLRFIRSQDLMPVLFADDWDAEANSWAEMDADDVPTEWDAFELFDTEIRRVSEEDNGLVRLQIEWHDPAQAAAWANGLVANLNDLMRGKAIEEATTNIAYLQEEYQNTNIVELRAVVSRLIETQISNQMLARTRKEYSFKVIDPAVVPDADQYVRPNRLFIVLFGAFAGLFLSLAILIITRRPVRD